MVIFIKKKKRNERKPWPKTPLHRIQKQWWRYVIWYARRGRLHQSRIWNSRESEENERISEKKTLDLEGATGGERMTCLLVSSKPSAVEGEASPLPPLQQRGVVGLPLTLTFKSPSLLASQRTNMGLDLGWRIPHLSAGKADFGAGGAACACFSLTNSSTTTLSSMIAARIHSSFTIIAITPTGKR